ncbi:MAG: ATP-dependent DNA helicase RecG [Candidatus Endobugula sp.]|jgi:ATP-dependent DNA helicase RecG
MMTRTANKPKKLTKAASVNASSPVTRLKGVGTQLASKLEKLGILSLQDLLFHLPRQYADRTRISPIGGLHANQHVVIQGEVRGTDIVFAKRRSLLCRLEDGTGIISLRFYHFSNAQRATLANGASIRCYGETRQGASGLELYHPEYQILSSSSTTASLEQTLTPIYPATEGITQKRLRGLVKQALTNMESFDFPNLLHEMTTEETARTSLLEPLRYLHTPPKDANLHQLLEGQHPYQQTLIIEELTAYQLSLLQLRDKRRQHAAIALPAHPEPRQVFTDALAFALTDAQQRVTREIEKDLSLAIPMMRLLQGDVGSGKTIVAALAALQAVANHQQVAIMAPTEILASQHRSNFEQWFTPLGISVGWLTGRQKVAQRREQLQKLEEGATHIIIGTHALFQPDVLFHNLALVIIDEQHRFGVHQRLSLRNKGLHDDSRKGLKKDEINRGTPQTLPHQLIMTATPIPRTLAMSAYADLDYSIIDELPKGRIPVETVVISQQKRDAIINRIAHACQQGRQAYWVCTLIEPSETLEAQAAEAAAEILTARLPKLSVGLVHGRLKSPEKDDIMSRFKAGEIDLLVATTVIEVGVDVANASLMIIENPERLGLAQLHQLRGRVGRGSTASHCVLLYGEALSLRGKERLHAMRSSSDGFKIAEIDLTLRGPGEILGTRQTGDIDFTLADLRRDLALMPQVKANAQRLLEQHPQQSALLIQRWLGNNENYANV